LKIGLIVPQTGRVAANGKEVIDGLQLFLEEEKRRLAGREVKLFVEDDESKPPVGLAKAKSLVEGQGVSTSWSARSAPRWATRWPSTSTPGRSPPCSRSSRGTT